MTQSGKNNHPPAKRSDYQPNLRWLLLMITCLVLSGAGFYQVSSLTYPVVHDRKEDMGDYPPFLNLPREVIDVIFLGQSALYDNFMLLWLTQYIGPSYSLNHNPEELEVVLRKIAQKKIRHEKAYLLSCYKFMMDFKKPWLCEDIARYGFEAVPESWLIPAVLGMVHLRQQEYLLAAEVFQYAGSVPNAPDYIQRLAATVAYKHNLGDQLKDKLKDQDMSAESRKLLEEVEKDLLKRLMEGPNGEEGAGKILSSSNLASKTDSETDSETDNQTHNQSAHKLGLTRAEEDSKIEPKIEQNTGQKKQEKKSSPQAKPGNARSRVSHHSSAASAMRLEPESHGPTRQDPQDLQTPSEQPPRDMNR